MTDSVSDPADVPREHDTLNRESHPNAAGPQGLTGDMGLSSERAEDFEGIEGTGSSASTRGHTDGETPTTRAKVGEAGTEDGEVPDKPDETSPVIHVDRTVGEVQPDPVRTRDDFDPSRNPGH